MYWYRTHISVEWRMCASLNIPTLVPIMACRQFGAKSLSNPMLQYCQLDHKEHISVKFHLKFRSFHSRKCTWKCRLGNGDQFESDVNVFIRDSFYQSILQGSQQTVFWCTVGMVPLSYIMRNFDRYFTPMATQYSVFLVICYECHDNHMLKVFQVNAR